VSQTSSGYSHDALFIDSEDELVSGAVPFLRAGLDADETAVLVCTPPRAALLREALGEDPRIKHVTSSDLHPRASVTIAACQRMMDRELAAGARGVRLVGDVDFGDCPTAWDEWARLQSVYNKALRGYPLWSVCVFDRRLPTRVLDAAEFTHPYFRTTTSRTPNGRYLEPADYLRRFAPMEPDPLEATAPALDIDQPTGLAELRREFHAALAASPLSPAIMHDFVLAVSEVATNAGLYGTPPVRVRLWSTPSRSLCAITDCGAGFDDPLAGYLPADRHSPSRGGMGLWLARQLCDHVDMSVTPEGFTVRLALRHREVAPPTCGATDERPH
jgi:anti-sigma regulatory factor (Ser/Thr protein kinase)